MVENVKASGHPGFRGTSALNRGILRREQGRDTNHFTTNSENIQLMLRYRKQLNPQEAGSLVQNQRRKEEAAGNIWRDDLQQFKMLDPDEQFCTIRESAGFKTSD